jgi:hypothetical protein
MKIRRNDFTVIRNAITLKPYFEPVIELNQINNQNKISFPQSLDFGLLNTKIIIPERYEPNELRAFILGDPYLTDNIIHTDSLVHLRELNITTRKKFNKLVMQKDDVLDLRLDLAKSYHKDHISPITKKIPLLGNIDKDTKFIELLVKKIPAEEVVDLLNENK